MSESRVGAHDLISLRDAKRPGAAAGAPAPQSPLHHFGLAQLARPADDSCGVWANEAPLQGYVSLRGDCGDPAFAYAAAAALGGPLPSAPCGWNASRRARLLRLSPDEWMIVCERAALLPLKHELRHALEGVRSQVADNSGGYTEVLLWGRDAGNVLAHVSVYDFSALAADKVVGTTFGKTSAWIHRDGDGFRLLFRRSFADYIWRFLVRAARPYGFGVASLAAEAEPVAQARVAGARR